MRLILPKHITREIIDELRKAGTREIGGILMGQHLYDDVFQVEDVTVQRTSGTFSQFVRLVQYILTPLNRFFARTDHNYVRFNYIGEWHSHPSFALRPSRRDAETMQALVEDPEVGAYFAVLLIVKLQEKKFDGDNLGGAVYIFQQGRSPYTGQLVKEEPRYEFHGRDPY